MNKYQITYQVTKKEVRVTDNGKDAHDQMFDELKKKQEDGEILEFEILEVEGK